MRWNWQGKRSIARRFILGWSMILAVWFIDSAAWANDYTFITIVDGVSILLGTYPAVNNDGVVTFQASLNTNGIFTGNGSTITELGHTGGSSPFNGFGGWTAINSAGTVAFHAHGPSFGEGIFKNPATAIANSTGPFSGFSLGSMNSSGTVVALATLDGGGRSIITGSGGGSTTTIATDTGSSFGSLPSVNDTGVVAFQGPIDGRDGVYTGDGLSITTVIDNSGTFNSFGNPSINANGTVAFRASKAGTGQGVFTSNGGGTAQTIADTNGAFSSFGAATSPAINSSGTVAFFANLDDGGTGIFTGADAVANKVIRTGDPLFGSTVTYLDFGRGLNDMGDVAFRYNLADGRIGIGTAYVGGRTQGNPRFPQRRVSGGGGGGGGGDTGWRFVNVVSGLWYDPPTAEGFDYTMTESSLFTDILDFPTGFDDPFTVSVGGITIGTFSPGQDVDFSDYAAQLGGLLVSGEGVSSFRVSGISPLVDPDNPVGFPLQIAFSTATASFDMVATPEPSALAVVTLTGLGLLGRRR